MVGPQRPLGEISPVGVGVAEEDGEVEEGFELVDDELLVVSQVPNLERQPVPQ